MRRIGPALIGLTLCAGPAFGQDKAAELCAEAAARYREMFGRDTASEPVKTILMYKYRFCPDVATAAKGDRLRYVNVDKRTSHSVWLRDDGKPESERVFPGGGVEVEVDLPEGEHEVLCGPHWQSDGMKAKIVVGK
jgi:plastocyanin